MFWFLVGFAIGFALVTCTGLASASPAIPDLSRTAVISGVIEVGSLDEVQDALQKWSADGSGKPISLVVDSPGGSVVAGFWFVNRMEEARGRGVKINCFVPNLAASMAFQILMHCDSRQVLEKSFLLWHPVRVSVGGFSGEPMTAASALELFERLHPVDVQIYAEIWRVMHVDRSNSYIRYHFEHETLHSGWTLARSLPSVFQSRSYIPGLLEALRDDKLPRARARVSIFGKLGTTTGEDIQYIAPDYIRELLHQ